MDIKPGIYPNMGFGEYLSLPIPSASTIKVGHNVSMRHMKTAVDGKLKNTDTKDRRFGRALHCWLFERERFSRDYAIQKHCMEVLGSGKRKGQPCTNWGTKRDANGRWLCGTHGKGLPDVENTITAADLTEIEGVGKSLQGRPVANILRQVGKPELTVIADVDGVLVKIRMDWYALSQPTPTIVDLKKITAGNGSEVQLKKAIRDYGYDVQASLYKRVHQRAFGKDCEFLWLFAEDSEPYQIIPRFLSRNGELLGQRKFEPVLTRWSECVAGTTEWTGYPDTPMSIEPDDWEKRLYGVGEFEINTEEMIHAIDSE